MGGMQYLKRWFGMMELDWFVIHNLFLADMSDVLVTLLLVRLLLHRLVTMLTSYEMENSSIKKT